MPNALRTYTSIFCLALASATTLYASTAVASPDDPRQEAASRFGAAIRLFDEKDYAGALAEFRRANDLAPNPVVAYNIARCYEALGRPVDAVRALAPLLVPGGAPEDQRARAADMTQKLEGRIGSLTIQGEAPGAHVEIDGFDVGVMPLKAPLSVAAGTRIVTIVATGYAPFRTEVVVAGKASASVDVKLVPTEAKLARLEVKSNVPGAEVRIAGQTIGKTPLSAPVTLLPGQHEVDVARRGYGTEHRTVTLGDGSTGKVDVTLKEAPDGPKGQLALRVSEPSPIVYVDGEARGTKLALSLPPGQHRIRVEHAGFLPSDRDVDLTEGGEQVVRVRLIPTAETRDAYESSVRAQKTWGWILVASGAAVGIGGGVLTITAASAVSDQKAAVADYDKKIAVGSGDPCSESNGSDSDPVRLCKQQRESAQAKLDNAKTRQVIGIIGASVGGAALITGTILLLTAPSADRFTAAANKKTRNVQPLFGASASGFSLGLQGAF